MRDVHHRWRMYLGHMVRFWFRGGKIEHFIVESCVRGYPMCLHTWLSQLYSLLHDRYWPLIFGCASQPSSLFFSLPHGTAWEKVWVKVSLIPKPPGFLFMELPLFRFCVLYQRTKKGKPWNEARSRPLSKGHKSHNKTSPVRILARVDSAVMYVEIFVGGKFHGWKNSCGKFRDTWVNKNNENSTPQT